MGGNLFTGTKRLMAGEYKKVSKEVLDKLKDAMPQVPAKEVKYLHHKESFGDMDIVCPLEDFMNQAGSQSGPQLISEIFNAPAKMAEGVWEAFVPKKDSMYNVSMNYKQFQVDFILVPKRYYNNVLQYYAYNDLGNLLGQVAKSQGLNYGHMGLSVDYKDNEGARLLGQWVIATGSEVFEYLGLSEARYQMGFDDKQQMFAFVKSSKYFEPLWFHPRLKSHSARIRDAKRNIQNDFLRDLGLLKDTNVSDLRQLDAALVPLTKSDEEKLMQLKDKKLQRQLAWSKQCMSDSMKQLLEPLVHQLDKKNKNDAFTQWLKAQPGDPLSSNPFEASQWVKNWVLRPMLAAWTVEAKQKSESFVYEALAQMQEVSEDFIEKQKQKSASQWLTEYVAYAKSQTPEEPKWLKSTDWRSAARGYQIAMALLNSNQWDIAGLNQKLKALRELESKNFIVNAAVMGGHVWFEKSINEALNQWSKKNSVQWDAQVVKELSDCAIALRGQKVNSGSKPC